MSANLVNMIFGMKVRQARLEAGLNLSEFAARCDLSPSYVTEIEKGRKYPKTDKIMKMASVLGKSYDDLVSIKLASSMSYLETMLSSPLLRQFPFEEFDLEIADLVNLFTRAPDKASALLHAVLEIGRQYDMKEEHFLRAALRSYQELHENYFQDLEEAAADFAEQYRLNVELPLSLASLQEIISQTFRYQLDETRLGEHPALAGYRSVFIEGTRPKLLLNAALHPMQIKFILARELGYRYLGLKERANTSAPDKVESFQQVLNDFKASYFAGALLMPRAATLADLQEFFQLNTWSPYRLLNMVEKYDVTPEMLFYRFCELIPQFFGIKLHFLRFQNADGDFRLVKQLNMNNLLLPSGIGLHEHYCRRWLAMRLLKDLAAATAAGEAGATPVVGAQISEFLESHERFLNFGFARPLVLSAHVGSSVIVGFRVDAELKQVIRFVEDPAIPVVIINETCERCPLVGDQCTVREAEPVILWEEKVKAERKKALNQLMAQVQN
ncbi:MAG: ImmA/IrrE family metallo-endopeptidase [Anaerolineales bacterium]|nr:ImmA/IrrE family metallo-endopeptidase [Anaerolineales bacterium]